MFDTPVSDLTPEATLTRVSHLTWSRNLLDAEELAAAAHWADLHAVLERSTALPGAETMVQFGGDGTPAVAEFAPAEFGAAVGITDHAASLLIGDALDLRHRHPLLWARVQAGQVKAWAARRIAQTTRQLDKDACVVVDRVVAPYADRKTPSDLVKITEAEVIRADPDLAQQRAEAAKRDRGVFVSPDTEAGVGSVFIRADATDITRFDRALDQVALDLARLGDDTSRHERRAKAVGILATPQLALDLHTQATGNTTPRPVTTGFPATTLYIHLTDQTLRTGDGVGRVEGIGPVTVDQVRDWLRHDHVTVKPVIDLPSLVPVDAYEIPDRLREAVHLAMPCDVFPYGTSKTRRHDLDHTIPYDDTGPPGQTRIGNLAPMSRRHHRTKTHSHWKVRQPFPGILIWQSPHGQTYLVDNTGTRRLEAA